MRRKVKGIKIGEIVEINKKCGGVLRWNNIDMAIALGRNKGLYTQIAYLLRAIVTDHSFSDYSKRTGYITAEAMLKRNGVVLSVMQKRKLVKQIGKIAKKNIENIKKISKMVEYATE